MKVKYMDNHSLIVNILKK